MVLAYSMNSGEKPYASAPVEPAADLAGDRGLVRIAEPRRRLDQRLQHRFEIECGAADDLQHVRCRRLLPQRLGQLARARLDLVKQTHVLDRDHGLVGEGGDQLDLFARERPDDVPRHDDHADRRIPAQQRHAEHGALVALGLCLEPGELGVFEQVGYVHGPAFERGPAGYRCAPGHDRVLRHVPNELVFRRIAGRHAILAVGFEPPDDRPVRLAEAGRGGDDGVQDRLQLGSRAADDIEDFAARSLLLERFAQFLRALLDLLIEAAELLAGAVDVSGERAELVAVADLDPPDELASREPAQPRRDLGRAARRSTTSRRSQGQREGDAAKRQGDHDQARGVIGALARLDPLEHVGLGDVDQLVGQALEPVGERPRLLELQLARGRDLAAAGALDRRGHDRDEAVVVGADLGEQRGLVLGDVLQPVEVVAELAELAQDPVELARVPGQQRGGDAVELARGVVLDVAVGGDLALQLDQLLGARVHPVSTCSPTAPSRISSATIARNATSSLVWTRAGARETRPTARSRRRGHGSFMRSRRSWRNSSSSKR